MTVRFLSSSAAVIALLGLAACGPGAAYDNLSGGSKVDAALEAPRPLSPLSISLIASSRPRLKWELSVDATGAIVEMCRTRACDAIEKTFETTGRELVVPEDLEPGIWFWRLRSRRDGKEGTKTSATWEMLVRGPAAHGSSDVPTGSILDYDGDGIPDLITLGDILYDDENPWPALLAFRGDASSQLKSDDAIDEWQIGPATKSLVPMTLAGGSDLDGDGFADMIIAGSSPEEGGWLEYDFGGTMPFADQKTTGIESGTFFQGVTSAREAGDVDGDGYGDVFAGDPRSALVHLGGAKGPSSFYPLMETPQKNPPPLVDATRALAFAAAFDSNADGFSDVAFGLPQYGREITPTSLATDKQSYHGADDSIGVDTTFQGNLILTSGSVDRVVTQETYHELEIPGFALPQAISFASGDFNGDGIPDLAGTVSIGSSRRVCVWFGDATRSVANGPCVTAAGFDNLLGEQLTAVDLEGDGVDELLALSSEDGASVKVFRFDGTKLVASEKVANLGGSLTTIWPGRPGKARWAARSADGHSIRVYEGLDVIQTVRAPSEIARGFARSMR